MYFATMRSCPLLVLAVLISTNLVLVHGRTSRSPFQTAPTAAAAGVTKLAARHRVHHQQQQEDDALLQHEKLHSSSSAAIIDIARGGGAVIENSVTNAVLGSIVLCVIEKAVKEFLKATDIKFPPMLGGCIFLFFFLIVTEALAPSVANTIFEALSPSAALLAKWLPMFFVPGLALLPLSPSIGTSYDIMKLLAVVALGLVYTAGTVAYSVLAIRTAQGAFKTATVIPVVAAKTTKSMDKKIKAVVFKKNAKAGKVVAVAAKAVPAPAVTTAVTKPFTAATLSVYTKISILTGACSIWATRSNNPYATPIQTIFVSAYTVMAYVWSARLPTAYVSIVHPLVTTALLILGLAKVMTTWAIPDHMDYLDFFRAYKAGSLHYTKAGAGDLFLYLLGPSVVCFAVSMYSRRALLCRNFLVVFVAMLVSSVGSLFSTAAFCRAIMLGGSGDAGRMIRLSILPRNVTTALAMVITELLGGDIGIAVAIVCITGVLGATYGKKLLNFMGITDPITRGLAIGSSAQGLGVASMVDEPDAFPFAAMSMVLTAISATTLVTIPAFRNALSKVAVGAAVAAATSSTPPAASSVAVDAMEQVIEAAATIVGSAT